ncbi:AAA family ATPase [Muricauda sp. SCSIO 64092]|uniref:GumC family protein n=1 Tax=Allomuricauda sp. SCSIO 64092 TaxID=2908842 RepID=UPI001FF68E50|nr:tyrosine-protein kinase domain-containing protein [Muricauda sp. SCSIO 64092]UOY05325.1 AAA family ATPase [Muricauda sp. SCSIO 64092]
MKKNPDITYYDSDEDFIDLKDIFFQCKRYWPWFLTSIVLCLCIGFFYLGMVPITYKSIAKIKIMDDSKELGLSVDALSLLGNNPKISLGNEMEILKSYRLLSQIVKELDLDVRYYKKTNLRSSEIWPPPFTVTNYVSGFDEEREKQYRIRIEPFGFTVIDGKGDVFTIDGHYSMKSVPGLPFGIKLLEKEPIQKYQDMEFHVVLKPVKEAVIELSGELEVRTTDTHSEILYLVLVGESINRSEAILNTIIEKFNQDGVLDRQLVSKRTLDFMDERLFYLSRELDSIEIQKKEFKQSNDLSHITADAELILQKMNAADNEVFRTQTQISLCGLLKKTISDKGVHNLLPVNLGLGDSSINTLISEYNRLVLKREELIASAGDNNPLLVILSEQLGKVKLNIVTTLNTYQGQLEVSLTKLNQEKDHSNLMFSQIPEKEKVLRAIERRQDLKEKLFLLLLQKREEAAINLAITEPSIKIVDYGLTSIEPVSPNKKIVMAISAFCGAIIPLAMVFIRTFLNTKINDRLDLEKIAPGIPILGEVPYIEGKKKFGEFNDGSMLAESFMILAVNINYLLPKKDNSEGQVIYVTSTIQGEGKTTTAFNLSLAYAKMKKKVLLIGSDLRNPQLHTYFNVDKSITGLADYLHNPEMDWQECVHEMYDENKDHKVCFGGIILPNAPEVLSRNAFARFIAAVKNEFEYIIVDTAPTILVTDTFLISKYADVTIYLTRVGFTDKRLLGFSQDLNRSQKLPNMTYLINDVIGNKSYRYNNYGYGYNSGNTTKSWYRRILKSVGAIT